tara:strand:- start:1124 stop:2599 length:1476 start_codon:yes stop_codon:yes gene_type:complete
MKHVLILISFFVISVASFSQQITGQLIDKNTGKAIQYATIKTGKYSGVISNEEGYFTINNEDYKTKTITISCLGYQEKTISVADIEALNFIIPLEEAINQLNEVYISNKVQNADSIIARVRAKIPENYTHELNAYNIFHRSTESVDFKSLEFEIEKASDVKKRQIDAANDELNALSKKISESDMIQFTDFKGELYNLNKDSSKLAVNKATKLMDFKNDFSVDDIQEKAKKIMLRYLDTTKTYKLKTGIFKIEDSLSLKNEDFKEDKNNEFEISHLNKQTRGLLKRGQFFKNSFLNKLLNPDYYDYTFEDVTYNNSELTYIISFEPRKSKAKFSGKLYISYDTYAVTRVNYNYYKNRHGEKVNLKLILGVKYIANVSEGLLLFEKNAENKYQPKYIKRTTGSYFYVNRDLKFIENSKARNKIGISFKIEGDNKNKEELLFTSHNTISLSDFDTVKQLKVAPIEILSKYEGTLWENEETLEPLKEMKSFEVKE